MKECEIFSNLKIPCGSRIVIRIDGRNFSKLSRDLKFEKPYDLDFVKIISDACHEFFREFSPSLIYAFSDEINILLDEIPFSGRVEKLDSVFASFISGTVSRKIILHDKFSKIIEDTEIHVKPISFDSRVIPINSEQLVTYFKGRQAEAWRNCLNSYAYWILQAEYGKNKATGILNKKKSKEIHEILFEHGIRINAVPLWQRRGISIYRKPVTVQGYNPISNKNVHSQRCKAITDWEMQIFDLEFFEHQRIL